MILVIILSFIVSVVFSVFAGIFTCLAGYDPIDHYIVWNIIVWTFEFIIAYIFVMGISWCICRKIRFINKWIVYISLIMTAFIIFLLPGGIDALFLNTFFCIISFIELFQMAYKNKEIRLFRNKDNDQTHND